MVLKSTLRIIPMFALVTLTISVTGNAPARADRKAEYLTERLVAAINYGTEADVIRLLNAGAQPNRASRMHKKPLLEAVYERKDSIARLLVQHGARLNRKDGQLALIFAANWDDPEMMRILIQTGVNPNIYSNMILQLPPHWYTTPERQAICTVLDSSGARKGILEATRLHDNRLLRDLLSRGGDPNSRNAEGQTALMCASSVDDSEFELQASPLDLLLHYGADPNAVDPHGQTALMFATKTFTYDAAEHVASLIKAGAHLEARDHDGETALFLAALNGRADVVQVLLDHGANIEARDHRGRTPLIAAADWHLGIEGGQSRPGAGEAMPILLANGADVNARDGRGMTALHLAARNRDSQDELKWLESAGADPNIADRDGVTPLMWACYYQNKASIAALRGAGARVGLVEAILLDDEGEIAKLIKAGANVNGRGPYGQTALMIAARKGLTDVCRQLLDAGANIRARDQQGNTALHCACGATEWWIRFRFTGYAYPSMTSNRENTALVSLLLDRGTDPNIANKNGETALFWAIDNGYAQAVQQLLSRGARTTGDTATLALRQATAKHRPAMVNLFLQHGTSPNLHTKALFSPLQIAIWEKEPDIAKQLIEAGADTNIPTPLRDTSLYPYAIPKEETPLRLAADREEWDMIPSLLAHGAKPNAQGADGATALIRAAYTGNLKAVQALLAAHTNPGIKDYCNKTARDYAAEQNHIDIAALLAQVLPKNASAPTSRQK